MRRSLIAAVVLALAIASGTLIARGDDDLRSPLAQALATLPDATLTANFTDWRLVRETVGAPDITSAASTTDRREWLDAAYEDDLSAASALAGSGPSMSKHFGWSVFDLDWEVLGQAREGAAIVAELSGAVGPDEVIAGLADLGYREPESAADDGGVWRGGPDLLATIDYSLSPMLQNVAVLADRNLVVLSDLSSYAERTVDTIVSESDDLAEVRDVAATAAPLDRAIAAVVHQPPRSCAVTSFDHASAADRQLAAARIAEAGGLGDQRGLGFGIRADDVGLVLDVSLHFESPAAAEAAQEPRTALAHGPAIGQGGTYDERFDVESVRVIADDLVLALRPIGDRMSLVSDLTSSPLLFSGCGG
ncbi:MAG TPA: hypothetical protein VEX15_11550 [Nocardioidaceae bacterium]|nr:hypothetical protein [Nocardioidaceae bacterium]